MAPATGAWAGFEDEISGDGFAAGGQTFAWTSLAGQAGPATVYDVMRGLVRHWPVGSGAAEICLAPEVGATQAPDTSNPALGTAYYYLVRGENVCGVGTYGATSSGTSRVTTVCP